MPQVLGTAATAAVIPTDPPDGSSVARALSLLWLSVSLSFSPLSPFVCLSFCRSLCACYLELICIPVYLAIWMLLYLSLSVYLPACLLLVSVCLSCVYICLSPALPICSSILPVCVCPWLCLFVCLSLSPSLIHIQPLVLSTIFY